MSDLRPPLLVGYFVALTTASRPVCVFELFKKIQKNPFFLMHGRRPRQLRRCSALATSWAACDAVGSIGPRGFS